MILQQEIDWRSPIDAFGPHRDRAGAVLLHGGERATDSHWSILALDPAALVAWLGGETFMDGAPVVASPFDALRKLRHARGKTDRPPCGAPFGSGLIGFAGYECARLAEPQAAGPPSPYDAPDLWFGAYDAVAVFDRRARRAFIVGRSRAALERLEARLTASDDSGSRPLDSLRLSGSTFTRGNYCAAVESVIEKIRDGVLYQANISHRLSLETSPAIEPFGLFKLASAESSAAFGAFFNVGRSQLISLSPERFFSVAPQGDDQSVITAEPIKGTRPRGATAEEDQRLRAELCADPKERAENIMIADLTRNDLSRLCLDHSVREDAICEFVTHATVHHLVSRISGVLRPGVDALDALFAIFPCGSVTGAPKVEAMKVIADIEGDGRGPYCGAIGYLDDSGRADFSVAIRIAVAENGRLTIPVGGGVTLRSDPSAEYEETMAKAEAFLRLARRSSYGRP